MNPKDYLVIDTEGQDYLAEVALVDPGGAVVYTAYAQEHPQNADRRPHSRPLRQILRDLQTLAAGKSLVCHYAEHDRRIIARSYRRAGLPPPDFNYVCTWELARQRLPALANYSLENLCKYLNLRVGNKRFDPNHAHSARYDAQFTHQLYRRLCALMTNPFDSSRVDHPFQQHPDCASIYAEEYRYLKSLLPYIQKDPNHQSRGAVVLGPAGSGKTHLIMRMAQELLSSNRLLFIRQPNHPQTVLYHTYARILESFAEKVPGTPYTQLELFIANSLIRILGDSPKFLSTQRGRDILASLQNDQLSLYQRLGKEGTDSHRQSWHIIERYLTDWWSQRYAAAGYAVHILKGLVRFCRYTDPTKKELTRRWLAAQELEPDQAEGIGLPNWQEDLSREEFALTAMGVFGKLSVLDQPLILVFDQLEGLGQAHQAPLLESFGAAVKEMLTHVPNSLVILNLFPERWQQFQTVFDPSVTDRLSQYVIHLRHPQPEQLRQMLQQRAGDTPLEELFTPQELADILNQKSIRAVLNRAAAYYRYKYQHIPLPDTPTPSREEQLEQALAQIWRLLQPLFSPSPSLPDRSATAAAGPTPMEILQPYLQRKHGELLARYDRPTVINDTDDLGKFTTLLETFQIPFAHLPLGKKALPELVLLPAQQQVIAFHSRSGSSFVARLKNFNELVAAYPQYQFLLWRDRREPLPSGPVTAQEIAKLHHAANGQFKWMEREDRLAFEVLYAMVTDIQNQDLEVTLADAKAALRQVLAPSWLTALLTPSAGA